MPSRRSVLTLSVAALGSGLAGCTTFGDDSSVETRIEELTAVNHESETHTVHVLVLEDGEPTYWDSVEIEARSDSSSVPGGEFEEYPTEPGSFVLYAWRDDQPRDEWKQFDSREYDSPCVELSVQVGTGDVPDGYVSIWRSFDCATDDEA